MTIVVPEGFVWIISYVIGYMIIGTIGNLFLITESKGTKFRWNLKPLKPYLKKNKAIMLAILQFLIPFILAIYINDFVLEILNKTNYFIIPISIIVLGIAYINIRSTLPYKITKNEKIIHASILVVGIILFIFMLLEYTEYIIKNFRWLTTK